MTAPSYLPEDPIDENSTKHSVDRKMLECLVCPLTKTSLLYNSEGQELVSRAAKLAFPIRNGIPIMLTEEARILDK